MFFFITWFCFIFVHNMLVQTLSFAKAHRRTPRLPPQRKTGGASIPFSRGEKPRGRLPIPESECWILWERKKIGARPSSFTPSDPSAISTNTATAPPWRKRGRHHKQSCWKLPPQREVSGSEAYAVKATHNAGSRPPREPTLHASLPIRPRTNCVCPCSIDVVWAGRNTQSVTWSAFALMFLCLCLG